ncbi:DNA-binding protein [Halostella sp. JP-L12]|uniref:helix-turn-helix domain-containing protein n=1 Tax=Halostella TaxID=1843185 RepID=UPI000EF84C83|nr:MULTISPECIES: helix-turn-helix domain-containing protein [Halostella]NHN49180.1 DNA-binding protein [Halostella sp. JP-L12]
MGDSIRAEIRVDHPSECQIASVSLEASSVRSISRSATPVGDAVTEEFTVQTDADVDGDEMDEIFSYDAESVYRFSRDQGQGCVCELVESHDIPIQTVRAKEGSLFIAFFVTDLDELRAIVSDLRADFDGVSLRRLTRSEGPKSDESLVYVDRNELTDRQREVLATAHDLGYFDHPKRANATEVSEELGINRSTFAEHLAAAQSTLLDTVLDA